MKMTRLLTLAGALVAACAALTGTAETPLGEGITHYYDFERNMSTKTDKKQDNFNITGRTWNAESYCLEINTNITLNPKGCGIDWVDPPKVPYTFGGALSGSENKAAFYKTDASHLCPSGECWTIAFWALRSRLTGETPPKFSMPLLLVNGIPILRKNLTADKLREENTESSDGFGFYVFREDQPEKFKVGVRLSEKKTDNTYCIRPIISNSPFEWYTTTTNEYSAQDRWHNIMLVRNNTELMLYVDGSPQGEATMASGSFIQAPANGLCTAIKQQGQGDENALDDLAIWNRTLTPAEIAGIAAGDRPISQMNGVKAGLTHYYDFETNRVSGKTKVANNVFTFDITGQVWNAEQGILEENPDITLKSWGKGTGTPKVPKTNFDNAYSGGGSAGVANFYMNNATHLCPSGAHWTISFWAMRKINKKKFVQPPLLVNGVLLDEDTIDNYTTNNLQTANNSSNDGFGFYALNSPSNAWGKVGVRLSQLMVNGTTTNYAIRSIVSEDSFPWSTLTGKNIKRTGLWHHVMLVRDRTALTLYVDGQAEGDTMMDEGSSVEVPSNGLFSTHVDNTGSSRLMMYPKNGLDDLTIWSRALNPGEREAVALGAAPVSLMAATPCRTMILIK